MAIPLTEEMRRLIEQSGDCPARVQIPGVDGLHVALPAADYAWLRGVVPDFPEVPFADDQGQPSYALVPESAYERVKALFEEDPLTPAERLALLRQAGLRAGWDDPDLDVYEEYRNSHEPR